MTNKETQKDVEGLAKELYEVCCYPEPTPYNNIAQNDKDVWKYRASIILDKYTRTPQPIGKELRLYHSCGAKMERSNSEQMLCMECKDFVESPDFGTQPIPDVSVEEIANILRRPLIQTKPLQEPAEMQAIVIKQYLDDKK